MHPILADKKLLGFYLLGWSPVSFFIGALLSRMGGISLGLSLIASTPLAGIYSLMCLAVWYPCRTFTPGPGQMAKLVQAHVFGALMAAALWVGLGHLWMELVVALGGSIELTPTWRRMTPLSVAFGVMLYLGSVVIHYLMISIEERRQAESRGLELRVLARDAELRALRAQIDPHFLFNSLNTVHALIGKQPELAREVNLRLSDFLRKSLRQGSQQTIPLAQELQLVRDYLGIEQARFGQRLQVEEDIQTGVEEIPIPPLLLQPLVENAVKHGIAQCVDGGTIRLSVSREESDLRIRIENPVDREAASTRGEGMGLRNVERRLQTTYEHRAELKVHPAPDSYRIDLILPIDTIATAD